MPDKLYKMTLKEAVLIGESWLIGNNLEWERFRYLSALTKNAGLVARGGRVSKLDQPTDLFKLPQDKIVLRAINKPRSTLDQAKAFFQRMKEAGIKYTKAPNQFEN